MALDNAAVRRATELERLAEFLDRHRLAENVNELRRAGGRLRESARDGIYSYRIDGVYFPLDQPRHPIPTGVTGIRAELKTKVTGFLDDDADDQFTELVTNIILTGTTKAGPAMFTWHLDRDNGESKSVDLHPRYHFQHAGQLMRAQEQQWGQSLLLDPPRFMHPPLDGVLAVDFILGSYLAKRYQKICMRDSMYVNLIAGAQRRAWMGFSKAIATFHERGNDWHKACYVYWPQVLRAK